MKKLAAVYAVCCMILSAALSQPLVIMPDSTNNRLVGFSPVNGSVVNPNMFALAGGTPIHAIQVGNEIWVSEQVGDRISRWSLGGSFLGAIGGGTTGGLDNIRGMGLVNNVIYVTNGGTGNGAPSGNSVVMFNASGTNLGWFSTASLAPSPFGVLEHQGGILVSSSSGNDDIHRFTLAGASVGTYHNSTSLNFVEQMDHDLAGNVLAAGFSSNNVVRMDPNTGSIINSFAASGARGVYQLSNGNILWTNSSGAHVFNVSTGSSTQVYTGGGRYLEFAPVPEPGSVLAIGAGLALLALRRRKP